MKQFFAVFCLCVVFVFGALAIDALAQEKEVFTCMALATAAPGSPATTRFTITIDEYSTEEDARKYLELLKTDGQAGLRKVLEKVQVGGIVPRGQLREPINFARSINVEGGRIINIVKTRYLRFMEFALGTPQSRDYDMTFIQLKINEDGEGEGYMFAGTRFFINDENRLVVEQRGTTPIKLSSVKLK
ncbi:MAG: hypothetical protein JRJ82_07695 [Deltaproteobacteria bacterium]|nr:hypothetical protein [Deltaproteobacteria bacterium]